jgi:hypothetical protein
MFRIKFFLMLALALILAKYAKPLHVYMRYLVLTRRYAELRREDSEACALVCARVDRFGWDQESRRLYDVSYAIFKVRDAVEKEHMQLRQLIPQFLR